MASKDKRPSQRLGRSNPARFKAAVWTLGLLLCGGGVYAAYRYTSNTPVEIAVRPVRKGDFVISVRTRGDIKSARSIILSAPQAPGLRIVKLAANGAPVHKGDVVVEFDASSQEQMQISREQNLQNRDNSITNLQAQQRMDRERDTGNKMNAEYSLERAKLDASKAEVLSSIDGEKARIQVGVSEGALQQVKSVINAHEVGNEADLYQATKNREKAERDLNTTKGYLNMMKLTAPSDGVVNILSNFRSQGTFGNTQPPFKEGDNVWTGAPIVEIPDLSNLYVEMKLEEVDRGKMVLGQQVRLRVDAIPDKEFLAEIDYISPIATQVFRGGTTSEKSFPARATLKNLDPRLRPGMSSTAEVIIEKQPNTLMIPLRASFDNHGSPAVYVQVGDKFVLKPIQIGKKNDEDVIVTSGLQEGDLVTLENPFEAVKRARKKF